MYTATILTIARVRPRMLEDWPPFQPQAMAGQFMAGRRVFVPLCSLARLSIEA
jgi:hypothetical protein